MSAVEGEAPLIARSYTRARRHPWVLGRIGDWTLPLGPYTPAQLVVAGVGVMSLIETYGVWAPVFGPLPLFGLGAAVWAVRRARIGGRVPAAAALGWLTVAFEPRAGRIGGRTARDRGRADLVGGFYVTDTNGSLAAAHPRAVPGMAAQSAVRGAHSPSVVRSGGAAAGRAAQPVALTVLQRMLANADDDAAAADRA